MLIHDITDRQLGTTFMKVKPCRLIDNVETICDPADAEYVMIRIPIPNHSHRTLPVILNGQRQGTNCWTWNGDVEKPTFMPSVLTKTDWTEGGSFVCHSFITDGIVQFLGDCTHEKAGTSEPLLDIDAPLEFTD